MRNSYYFRHDLESPLGYRLEGFIYSFNLVLVLYYSYNINLLSPVGPFVACGSFLLIY